MTTTPTPALATNTTEGAPMHSAARPRTTRLAVAAGLASLLALTSLGTVDASSHREAPLISMDPVADNTDTYAFVSPSNPDNTVLVANYIPLQQPDGGPNFYNFGDDVLYAINVDNDGDAVADVTYEWSFTTELAIPTTSLYNIGPIDSLDAETWNIRQTYTLSAVRDGVRTVLGQDLPVPPNNIGPRSTPNYAALAEAAVVELDGGITAFAGQRDDPFWVDLGAIFDLGVLRPFEAAHLIDQPQTEARDAVAGKNVHSLVLEVPSELLTNGDDPVIGVWATASRRQVRTFADGSSAAPVYTGPFRQVSRLGMPLVNEVVIPTGLKDAFNTLMPSQDAAVLAGVGSDDIAPDAGYQPSTEGDIPIVTDPEIAGLLEILYPSVFGEGGSNPLPPAPRNDLVTVFLTGVPDLNQLNGGEAVPAEYIRLNTSIAPANADLNDDNQLGVIGGDTQGYPNGRRLGDDTVDISLRVVAGELVNGAEATPDLDDGVLGNDVDFLNTFPYVAHPHSGYYSQQTTPAENNL
jgi:hypothetical protein